MELRPWERAGGKDSDMLFGYALLHALPGMVRVSIVLHMFQQIGEGASTRNDVLLLLFAEMVMLVAGTIWGKTKDSDRNYDGAWFAFSATRLGILVLYQAFQMLPPDSMWRPVVPSLAQAMCLTWLLIIAAFVVMKSSALSKWGRLLSAWLVIGTLFAMLGTYMRWEPVWLMGIALILLPSAFPLRRTE